MRQHDRITERLALPYRRDPVPDSVQFISDDDILNVGKKVHGNNVHGKNFHGKMVQGK